MNESKQSKSVFSKIAMLALSTLCLICVFIVLACGSKSESKQKAGTHISASPAKDTVIEGVLTKLSIFDYRGKTFRLMVSPSPKMELQLKYEVDEPQNPLIVEHFPMISGGYKPKGAGLGKKYRLTCKLMNVPPSDAEHTPIYYVTNMEVIDNSIAGYKKQELKASLVDVTTGDSTCLVFDSKEQGRKICRLYYDQGVSVNLSDAEGVFTYKNYSTQLNPKYAGQRAKVVIETKPVYTTRGSIDEGINRKAVLGEAVTKISFD